MYATIQERINKLEAAFGLLNLPEVTRVNLLDAVRDIAIEQDKITRWACAETIEVFKLNNRLIACEKLALDRARDAILNPRSLYP